MPCRQHVRWTLSGMAFQALLMAAVFAQSQLPASAQDDVRRIPGDPAGIDDAAVIVKGRELIHTTQLLPVDADGKLVGAGDPVKQFAQCAQALKIILARHRVRPVDMVKYNFYVADEATMVELRRRLHEESPGRRTAVSLVTTRLPVEGALIALDAVAARGPGVERVADVERRQLDGVAQRGRIAHSAVLPVGETIYVSGQAEPGSDLPSATAATLAGLKRTLEHLGLGLEHVVQLKCFLLPMSDVEQTYIEIERFFGDDLAPPTSVVEWISSLPIEIEMIVHAPQSAATGSITHEWLPWLTVSPVYCRYVRIPGDTQIFISGCFGAEGSDDAAQVAAVFEQLQARLAAAGSDLNHMAKATYYVSNDAASTAVNEIRPTLYNPQHPPAASKALVHGVGLPGRSFILDMIAVPAE